MYKKLNIKLGLRDGIGVTVRVRGSANLEVFKPTDRNTRTRTRTRTRTLRSSHPPITISIFADSLQSKVEYHVEGLGVVYVFLTYTIEIYQVSESILTRDRAQVYNIINIINLTGQQISIEIYQVSESPSRSNRSANLWSLGLEYENPDPGMGYG